MQTEKNEVRGSEQEVSENGLKMVK